MLNIGEQVPFSFDLVTKPLMMPIQNFSLDCGGYFVYLINCNSYGEDDKGNEHFAFLGMDDFGNLCQFDSFYHGSEEITPFTNVAYPGDIGILFH
jgi:hypothetical protein